MANARDRDAGTLWDSAIKAMGQPGELLAKSRGLETPPRNVRPNPLKKVFHWETGRIGLFTARGQQKERKGQQ
jgi:hypothetical protein